LLSRGYSFDTPSIVLAPSTPQKGNTPQKGDSLEYDHNGDFVATPRRNDMSQSPDSRNGPFGTSFSCASMDEGDRADMSDSMGYFEQEESSEIEIKPVATSTPKGNRRLTVSTGLDSIVEVLTPRSARGQHFDVSDLYRNENPSLDGSSRAEERVGPVGDGISSSLSGPGETMEKGMLPIELSEKVAKREISRDPTRATSASKNRSVAPRSSTPTLGKVLAKDQKQRFTLGSSSSTPSGAAGYKVCIVSGFGSLSADFFDSGQQVGRRPGLLVDRVTTLQAGPKNSARPVERQILRQRGPPPEQARRHLAGPVTMGRTLQLRLGHLPLR